MLGIRLTGCLALVALAVAVTGSAAVGDDLLDLRHKPDGTYGPFPSKTAKGLMTPTEYAAYKAHLDKLECDDAETLLNGAFIRAYPQHSKARKTGARRNRNHLRWTNYAASKFMEYGFCEALFELVDTEAKLGARNISLRKYTPRKFQPKILPYAKRKKISDDQFLLEQRERTIGIILSDAQLNFIPAVLKIAELVRRGDVFDVGNDFEYYLLVRARHLGHSGQKLRQRLQELSRSLPEARRRDIELKADGKWSLVVRIFDYEQPL